MKKIIFVSFLVVLGTLFLGCSNTSSIAADPGIRGDVVRRDYDILGIVSIEKPVHSVLGLFNWGGCTYKELLEESLKLGGDGIINIYRDQRIWGIFVFYNRYTDVLTATAIKYKNPVPAKN